MPQAPDPNVYSSGANGFRMQMGLMQAGHCDFVGALDTANRLDGDRKELLLRTIVRVQLSIGDVAAAHRTLLLMVAGPTRSVAEQWIVLLESDPAEIAKRQAVPPRDNPFQMGLQAGMTMGTTDIGLDPPTGSRDERYTSLFGAAVTSDSRQIISHYFGGPAAPPYEHKVLIGDEYVDFDGYILRLASADPAKVIPDWGGDQTKIMSAGSPEELFCALAGAAADAAFAQKTVDENIDAVLNGR